MGSEIYKSKFTGQQIDQRLEKVTTNTSDIANINTKVNNILSNVIETKVISKTEPTAEFPQVLYTPQNLTNKQKEQVRKNIGIETISFENSYDWSNETNIKIPQPKYCAKVNIISNNGLSESKTDNKTGILEYWDKGGNYFKKYIKFHAQGTSSLLYIEKNQTIDIFNDEACTDSCNITFGNWVAQDSFHLKAYYIDVFRGISNVVYNLCEEVIQYIDARNNRNILNDTTISSYNSTGNFMKDFGDGALCHPDGFPFELYVNNEYYGLYAWNLKKHRKNYSMDKNDYNAILLDGVIDNNTFFNGTIDWTAFELRNPKKLITMDGNIYDADLNCNELINTKSSYYDASNDIHKKTAEVKEVLIRQSCANAYLYEAANNIKKSTFEDFYDYKSMAVYFILSNVLYNHDGFSKNWVWTLYNGKMAPTFYDMDIVFGRWWDGTYIVKDSTIGLIGTEKPLPTGWLYDLYVDELTEMYKSLRSSGVLSTENIMKHLNNWIEYVGYDAYNRNLEKWTNIPSYRSEKTIDDGTNEGGFFDSPKRIKLWLDERFNYLDEVFV